MVKNILGMVAGGYGVDRILQAYPELTREMVEAAPHYAATVIDEEKMLAYPNRRSSPTRQSECSQCVLIQAQRCD